MFSSFHNFTLVSLYIKRMTFTYVRQFFFLKSKDKIYIFHYVIRKTEISCFFNIEGVFSFYSNEHCVEWLI